MSHERQAYVNSLVRVLEVTPYAKPAPKPLNLACRPDSNVARCVLGFVVDRQFPQITVDNTVVTSISLLRMHSYFHGCRNTTA
jgi:hypothetical protein